eukprot:10016702-Alexandrium_andersonii.AAC.1
MDSFAEGPQEARTPRECTDRFKAGPPGRFSAWPDRGSKSGNRSRAQLGGPLLEAERDLRIQ